MRIHAFLIIEQPRQRLGHWINSLVALDSPLAPRTAAVAAHYDPTTDQALLELAYDPRALDESGLSYVINLAILAEVGMVQPAELSDGERERFLSARLARCTIRVTGTDTVIAALSELVKRIKNERAMLSGVKPPASPPPPPPAVTAKGTRDNLEQLASDAVLGKMPPVRVPDVLLRDPVEPTPQVIYGRYLRGGRWVPVRVGALSLKGAALLTGALPRLHDRVEVELAFGAHRVQVRGSVTKTSTVREASATGASTFTVTFRLDEQTRPELTQLLLAARAAKITIKPPPARATRRFPVEWQVQLGTKRGALKGLALDFSTGGMFVQSPPLEIDALVGFSVSLDDGGGPIAGRARVARSITASEAVECGLVAGYGLEITDMTEPDRMRWMAFLARIERRAQKRVIIGAEPSRLAELQAGLASLGYAVVGGTDPGALVQLANAETRPADAVLLDAGWLQSEASTAMVEKLMAARNLPCVTMQGEPKRARQAIDELLEVVV